MYLFTYIYLLNPGPCTHEESALPLSYTSSPCNNVLNVFSRIWMSQDLNTPSPPPTHSVESPGTHALSKFENCCSIGLFIQLFLILRLFPSACIPDWLSAWNVSSHLILSSLWGLFCYLHVTCEVKEAERRDFNLVLSDFRLCTPPICYFILRICCS
jgi:hypothetical protein